MKSTCTGQMTAQARLSATFNCSGEIRKGAICNAFLFCLRVGAIGVSLKSNLLSSTSACLTYFSLQRMFLEVAWTDLP